MLFLAVFLLCLLVEVLYAQWAMAVQRRDAAWAGLMAGALQVPVLLGLAMIVVSGWYVIPNILGHAFGSYVAVKRGNRGSKSFDNEEARGTAAVDGVNGSGDGPGDTWKLLSHHG